MVYLSAIKQIFYHVVSFAALNYDKTTEEWVKTINICIFVKRYPFVRSFEIIKNVIHPWFFKYMYKLLTLFMSF